MQRSKVHCENSNEKGSATSLHTISRRGHRPLFHVATNLRASIQRIGYRYRALGLHLQELSNSLWKLEVDGHRQIHRCQPSRIRRDSPAFSSVVPRNQQMSRIFRKWYYYIFPLPINDHILHVCLATQQSDELRIKIGKDRFRIRTPTGH